MELILDAVDFVFHIDKHLNGIIGAYGSWTYVLLALVVFCETGLVVTPFLPGDSLLFATGALAATGSLDVGLVFVVLLAAVTLGDNVNYWVGHSVGPKVFAKENSRLFKKAYLDKTHAFYERHGGKTVIMARFVPIVRTFAPFVAGVGRMPYPRFLGYSIGGAILWLTIFLFGGYLFGNVPLVKNNFAVVIVAVVFVSVLPPVVETVRARLRRDNRVVAGPDE
ncbi:MAG: DedA family protein [Candidatus Aquicultorales bacterium]